MRYNCAKFSYLVNLSGVVPIKAYRRRIERGFMWFRKVWAFTLIEILVVISIIALLMSILMPSLMKAREQAKRAVCMTNLRSIGQGIYIYANDNKGRLVPGDFPVPWDVWAEPPGCSNKQSVNLGYLLTSGALPIPMDDNNVFFCPSRRNPDNSRGYEGFSRAWGSNDFRAQIHYMFNNALDGFWTYVGDGQLATLSHNNKINFLQGDGSVHTFGAEPLVFDEAAGPELLQEVCDRYGVCFPTIMLHRWLEIDEVDLDEAREYLANPLRWFENNHTDSESRPILLADVSKRSLVCDVVGFAPGAIPTALG